ncbi:unnamed protein product [Bursaphelenchus okinawaensis]|uniref:Uncharacterized protein n=1 Tax=Bursaphelenchus okinawaensis TaxID=465554 RepID=A0A811KC19_9BILA|nr:unnamed protein product [Bursaphelenchus okinawaensis]CAG9097560.1 unnamed protein product [Bursaphelenchus okinawaensis]
MDKDKLGVYNHFGFFRSYEEAYESVKLEYRYQKTLRDKNVRVYRCRSHRGNKCNSTVKIVAHPDGQIEVGKRFPHSHGMDIFDNIWGRNYRKNLPESSNAAEFVYKPSPKEYPEPTITLNEKAPNDLNGFVDSTLISQDPNCNINKEKEDKRSKLIKIRRARGPRGPYKKKNKLMIPESNGVSSSEHSINLLVQSLQQDQEQPVDFQRESCSEGESGFDVECGLAPESIFGSKSGLSSRFGLSTESTSTSESKLASEVSLALESRVKSEARLAPEFRVNSESRLALELTLPTEFAMTPESSFILESHQEEVDLSGAANDTHFDLVLSAVDENLRLKRENDELRDELNKLKHRLKQISQSNDYLKDENARLKLQLVNRHEVL